MRASAQIRRSDARRRKRVKCEIASLFGLSAEFLISTADTAAKRQLNAVEAFKTFRALGARKLAIDELNALRKSTAGILSEMPHKFPEKRLPNDYADRFFKRAARRGKTATKEMTASDLQSTISEQEQVLATLKSQLVDVLAKEEAENRAKAELDELKIELAAAEKTAAEAAARIAAIKSKMA